MAQSLILSVGADGRFAGVVVAEFVRRGAFVRGWFTNPKMLGRSERDTLDFSGSGIVTDGDTADPLLANSSVEIANNLLYGS